MKYLFNALVLPVDPDRLAGKAVFEVERISEAVFCEAVRDPSTVSVVGHEPTARVIGEVCGREPPVRRETVFMEPGDVGYHLVLRKRAYLEIPAEEMKKIGWSYFRSRRVR